MKKAIVSLLVLGSLVFVKPVVANEGIFRLRTLDGSNGACFATSIFVDGSYRILMTCRDLRMAVDPEQNKYVAWTEQGTKKRRIGEVINGKFQGRNEDKFDRILITLEKDATTTKTEGKIVLSGGVEAIDFGKGIAAVTVTPQPTATPTLSKATTKTETTTTTKAGVSSALGAILKVALFGFGLLIVVVGIFGFMSRRKNL